MAHGLRSRFPRTSVRGPRKTKTWSTGPNGQTALISSGGSTLFAVVIAASEDLTVLRMHGQFTAKMVTAAAEGDLWDGALGICKVNTKAAAVGVTAIPDPLLDMDWDGWFVHKTFSLPAFGATPAASGILQQYRYDIDSKAMRKFNQTDTMVGVVGLFEVGTTSVRCTLTTRVLTQSQ